MHGMRADHRCEPHPPLTIHEISLLSLLFQVIVHTGDAWGNGCTSELAFEVIGTHGRLLSQDCKVVEVHGTTDRRQRAVEYAQSLEWPKDSSGLQVGKAEKVGDAVVELLYSFRGFWGGGNPQLLVTWQGCFD